ncbi:MAG: type II secretion system F family protein [Planctomycetaceae bacterium]|nr:type II secretion system F family protein [Planctomycetaceae bacterium]
MLSEQLFSLVIAAACFGTAALLIRRSLQRRREKAILSGNTGESVHAADWPADRNNRGWLFGSVTPLLAALLPESQDKRALMKRELVNAGYYHPRAADNLAAIRYLGIVLPILVSGLLLLVVSRETELTVLFVGVAASLLGWALPALVVRRRAAERREDITRAMPDMLDMLNMCVSQGMTLTASLTRVVREIRPVYPALAHELQIVGEQARIGSTEQALANFAERVDMPEVRSFTSTLIQTERMGTSVSAALADHSDNIRESRKQRAEQAANTAVFKMIFPISLCLMPAVLMFLMGPAVVDLTEFFGGEGAAAFRTTRAAASASIQGERRE